ncbi:unnamed protein product [Dicrocoelium dendriticum]|nr:unnamed protein product [Dicrocoelium dendriticum]
MILLLFAFPANIIADYQRQCFPSRPPESEGTIFLRNYQPKMFCSATLSAPNAHGIHLDFDDIALEYNHIYLLDYLVIFDGPDCMAPRLAVAYGHRNQLSLSSQQNKVSLLFISDYNTQNAGFKLKYRPGAVEDQWKKNNYVYPNFHQNILHNCGTELNANTSNIIFWRGLNKANTLCIWRITNDIGSTITLKIEELQIKSRSGFLRILDGPDCGAKVIYTFEKSNRTISHTIQGSSNAMMVVLSVPGEKGSVFNATISFNMNVPCFPSHPTESIGRIEIRNYQPKMFCSATLSVPYASGIHLDFDEISLEYMYDYLIIFDGPDCMAPRIAMASGSNHQMAISAQQNKVSLLFISDHNVEKAGFHLKYRPEKLHDQKKTRKDTNLNDNYLLHNCGTELNTSTSNVIYWKGLLAGNNLCIWRITNDQGGTITLKVQALQVNRGLYSTRRFPSKYKAIAYQRNQENQKDV